MYYPENKDGYSFTIDIIAELLIDNIDEFMVMYMDLYNDIYVDEAKKKKFLYLNAAIAHFTEETVFDEIQERIPVKLIPDFDDGCYYMEVFEDSSDDEFEGQFILIVEKNLMLRKFELELDELFQYYGITETSFMVTGIFSIIDLCTNGDAVSEEFNGCEAIHDGIYGILNEFDYDLESFFSYYIGGLDG